MIHGPKHAAMRRRVMSFSLISLALLIVVLGLFRPDGLAHPDLQLLPDTGLRPSDVTWSHAPVLFVTGLGAGLLSGVIGMGGGVLKMSFMLLLLKLDVFFARAISIVTMFVSSAAALWGYIKQGNLTWSFALRMVAVGVPAGLLASVIGNDLHETTLKLVFAFFVLFLSFNTLALIIGDPHEKMMRPTAHLTPVGNEGYISGAIGGLHGATCGLLGISGGVIATPLQQIALHMPLRQAIGNTLLVSTAVTFVAGASVLWTGIDRGSFVMSDVLFVDLFVGGGAVVGAPIGTRLSQRCNITALRLLFVALTLTAGISILSGH